MIAKYFSVHVLLELTCLSNSLELMKKVSQVLLSLTQVHSHRSHMYLAENDVLDVLFSKVIKYIMRTFVLMTYFM